MPSNLFRFSVTASKVAGTRLVIEAVTGVQISVTASKVAGIRFVIEAVTGESVLLTASKVAGIKFVIEAPRGHLPIVHLTHPLHYSVFWSLFRGGCLGVGWGLAGGCEGVPRAPALRTPRQLPRRALRTHSIDGRDGEVMPTGSGIPGAAVAGRSGVSAGREGAP